jgi:PGF-CTERM protein
MKKMKMKRLGALVLIGILLVGVAGLCTVSATTEAVHFSKLIEFLPDAPSGWEGEEPEGMTLTYEEGTWSMATESYSKTGTEDVTADVAITDYAFYTVGWSAAWQGFYAWESTEGYAKTTKVNGFPAWEIYDKDSNDYSLSVGINDRFMVLINTNSDKDTLYAFANSIDYKGIATLGGGVAPPAEEEPEATPYEEAPTEAPKVPEDEGKAPGFEVVFAVAGLLTVAYLLRRR